MLSLNAVNLLLESLSPDLAGATVLRPQESAAAVPSMSSLSRSLGRRGPSAGATAAAAAATAVSMPRREHSQSQPRPEEHVTQPRRRQPLTAVDENAQRDRLPDFGVKIEHQQQQRQQLQSTVERSRPRPKSIGSTMTTASVGRRLPSPSPSPQPPAPSQQQAAAPRTLIVRGTEATAARQRRNRELIARAAAPRTFFGAPIVASSPTREASSQSRSASAEPNVARTTNPQQQAAPAATQQPIESSQRLLASSSQERSGIIHQSHTQHSTNAGEHSTSSLLDRIATPPPREIEIVELLSQQQPQVRKNEEGTRAAAVTSAAAMELIHMSNTSALGSAHNDSSSFSAQPAAAAATRDVRDQSIKKLIERHEALNKQALAEIRMSAFSANTTLTPAAAAAAEAPESATSLFAIERAHQLRQRAVSEAQDSARKRERRKTQQQQQVEEQEEEAVSEQRRVHRDAPSSLFLESLRDALRAQPMSSHEAMLQTICSASSSSSSSLTAAIPAAVCEVASAADLQLCSLLPVSLVMCVPAENAAAASFSPIEELFAHILELTSPSSPSAASLFLDFKLHSHGSMFLCLRSTAPGKKTMFLVWYPQRRAGTDFLQQHLSTVLNCRRHNQVDGPASFDICLFWRRHSSSSSNNDAWWRKACSVVEKSACSLILHDAGIDNSSAIGQMISPLLLDARSEEESLLLGCGVSVRLLHLHAAVGNSIKTHNVRCLLSPFQSRYALWRRAALVVAQQQQQPELPRLSVVLAHDAASSVVSFAKAACGGLSNFGIVSGRRKQSFLAIAASSAGANFVADVGPSPTSAAVVQPFVSSAASTIRSALTVASENMWRGIVVELPACCCCGSGETGEGAAEAVMNVLARWPFDYPSTVVLLDTQQQQQQQQQQTDLFDSVRDGFQALHVEEVLDALLV